MKKEVMKIIVMVGLVALTFGSAPAWADDESPVSASGDIAVFSEYIWRGYKLSEDTVLIQPSVSVAYGGLGFNLWGNLDMDEYGTNDSNFNETDMTLSYDWSFDTVSMGVGYIYYGIEGEDTQEAYFSIALDTVLAPSLTIYRDFDTFPGFYYSLGIGHSIPLGDMSLDLSAAVGYYDVDYYDYSEFHDGSISASITIPVNDYISFTPVIAYSFALTDESEADMADMFNDSDHIYGGITFSIAF